MVRMWGGDQCDQTAKLFVQYLAIYKNENLPNNKKLPKMVKQSN